MNRERDIERVLDAWLEAGSTVMPDRVFDGVLDRIERQPQRRLARLQQRFFPMRPSMILAAAAAIAIAVGAGVVLLGRPATPDVAAPSVAPSVAPTPTASPSPSPAAGLPEELRYRWIGAPRAIEGISDVPSLPLLWMAEPSVAFSDNLGGRFLESLPTLLTPAPAPGTRGPIDGRLALDLRSFLIGSCRIGDTGTYTWRLSADRMTLTLAAVSDPCAVRAAAFSGTWTRSDCRNPADTCLGVVPAGTYVSTFLNVRGEPGQLQHAGAFGQLRYTVPDGWANMDDWPASYSLIPAADYAGPIGEPTGDRATWHDLSVLARPAPAESCSISSTSSAAVSAADLAVYVAGHPALEATAPAPVAVGSLTGTMIDVRLRDDWTGTCPDLGGDTPMAQLLAAREGGAWAWGMGEGERQRLIFVDIGGGATVLIAVVDNTSAARFDELVAAAMPVIATFEFPLPE